MLILENYANVLRPYRQRVYAITAGIILVSAWWKYINIAAAAATTTTTPTNNYGCCCWLYLQCNWLVGWHFMTTRNDKAHVIGWLVIFFEYLYSGLW